MQHPWVYDVVTEHAALTTTGGRVWDAALRLCSYLEAAGPDLVLDRPGLRVLELGSGLGWLGMTLARNLIQPEAVVLTEQEEGGGLEWLRHNLALNAHLPGMEVVSAEPGDWRSLPGAYTPGPAAAPPALLAGEPTSLRCPGLHYKPTPACLPTSRVGGEVEAGFLASAESRCGDQEEGEVLVEAGKGVGPDKEDCEGGCCSGSSSSSGHNRTSSGGGDGSSGGCRVWSQRWDLVLGSDLVYNEVGAQCLPQVMRALAGPGTRILYCHTKHRFDTYDMQFFAALEDCGLRCTEVREMSQPSPPPSPPPLTELFPEMRIIVYDIRLAEPTET